MGRYFVFACGCATALFLSSCKNSFATVEYSVTDAGGSDTGHVGFDGSSSSASSSNSRSSRSSSSASSQSSFSSSPSQTLKDLPSGIYDLQAAGVPDLSTDAALDNPNVDGYRLRVRWTDIQPDNAASYNWAALDATLSLLGAHGKKVGIAIASGTSTPEWVYSTAPTVYKYAIKELGSGGKSVGNMPLPWDTAYQAKWKSFLKVFGSRYDQNPTISYVVVAGFAQNANMQMSKTPEDDAALMDLASNPPAGFSGLTTSFASLSDAYVPSAKGILDTYGANFKITPLVLTLYAVYVADQGRLDQYTVRDYGLAQFPRQFGTMVSALYATNDSHDPPSTLSEGPKGFQMVWRTGDPTRSVYKGGVLPDPPQPQPLYDALANGSHLAGQYVEVYPPDIWLAVNQSVLATERQVLKDNVP